MPVARSLIKMGPLGSKESKEIAKEIDLSKRLKNKKGFASINECLFGDGVVVSYGDKYEGDFRSFKFLLNSCIKRNEIDFIFDNDVMTRVL